jgi:hypothetical protein
VLIGRLGHGSCSTGDVAKLGADVLANPLPLVTQRLLREVGTDHEGSAAVAFLDVLRCGEATRGIAREGRLAWSARSLAFAGADVRASRHVERHRQPGIMRGARRGCTHSEIDVITSP